MIDDRREVCDEAEAFGLLPYQVCWQQRPRDADIYKVKVSELGGGPLEHLYSENLAGSIHAVLSDDLAAHQGRTILDRKLEAIDNNKSW